MKQFVTFERLIGNQLPRFITLFRKFHVPFLFWLPPNGLSCSSFLCFGKRHPPGRLFHELCKLLGLADIHIISSRHFPKGARMGTGKGRWKMALAGIADSINIQMSNLLGSSAFFAHNIAKAGTLEQLQPNQLEELEPPSDFVSLSDEALKLSSGSVFN